MSNTISTKRIRRTLAAMAVLAGGLIGTQAAEAAPLAAAPAATLAADAGVETVQWHHPHGWGHRRFHRHRHHGWGHHHHRHHGWGHHRRHHWGHHRHHHWGHHHGWRRHHHFY
ncbi:hypothetical protein [Methylorubrum salsuginis]|uniref:Uncharacterized protein n=1 Tax=Methylorubrum salsuginis TaxID=414703 RepID=A0A1I4GZ22_9HYPH|nr:hypothetical protein [Methylorubrum salsuginis]SFL34406.1 hypothetical protein SAMN04488125_11342 [Methylorubrum salsuginis]